ncbi:MAG: bifunctional phosphoribosylaminoimidazolecarboxamide formyltransferase/IMP cyclohydrolase [Gammaproteobacteria bacterium WSBS_2016_MAG_OTU1]
MKIKTALISVANKSGLYELSDCLQKRQITIYSTGGTAQALRELKCNVLDITELTGFEEILDGRVKTLHSHIHASILADGNNPQHLDKLKELGLPPLDLVVVNFYPFEQSVAGGDEAKIIANIDIGGPTMARAAAKNHASTVVLTDPQDYPAFIGEMEKSQGNISPLHSRMLAAKAFVSVAHLDAAIANHFSADDSIFPAHYFLHLHRQMNLKYGENPHQAAACYEQFGSGGGYVQLHGAPLSYNNILDAQAGCELVSLMDKPAAAIIKHNNPCGAAFSDEGVRQAFYMARRCDATSSFGGIVALNREVDGDTAEALTEMFLEAVLAPQYSSEAKEVFASRVEKFRVLLSPEINKSNVAWHSTGGLLLAQTADFAEKEEKWKAVTAVVPTEAQWQDLRFAWRVAMIVKSNAIVVAKGGATLGVGAGQMSRIDSARFACQKAERSKLKLEGAVAASDAFFPFADGVTELIEAGVTAIIQPGGSKRDSEVIDAANDAGIAMVFTNCRHFRH